MNYQTSQPRIASYVIMRREGKVAFVFRTHTSWMANHYGLVQGKVEKGETYLQAAVREAKEEAGVNIRPDRLKYLLTMQRREPGGEEWVDVFFETAEWEGEPYNAEPDKHGDLVWLNPTDLPDNTIPMIKFALEQIKAGVPYAVYGYEA